MYNDNNSNSEYDSSNDIDTIPDEEFKKNSKPRVKQCSWPNNKSSVGPNINLKFVRKRYSNDEEKQFFFEKIQKKKKTELCKNFELYHDCYYKTECSFAHGSQELRQDCSTNSYKTKICKGFQDKLCCTFGQRCHYRHVLKSVRLLTFSYLLKRMCDELIADLEKKENANTSVEMLYQRQLNKRSLVVYVMIILYNAIRPRLKILGMLAPCLED